MAADSKKGAEEDSGEFAEFMADISQEIAQRVESLEPAPKPKPEARERQRRSRAMRVSFSSGRTWRIA